MFSGSMLFYTNISQWGLFLGVGLIIFGWVEKRKNLVLAGQFAFLALGLFGLWMLLTHHLSIPADADLKLNKAARTMAYFRGTVYFMVLTVVSLFFEFFKVKYRKFLVYTLVIIALMLFFMVVNVQQMPN